MTEVDILLAGGGLLAGVIAFVFLFGGKNPVMHKREFQLNSRTRMATKIRKRLRGGKKKGRSTEG